MQHNTFVSVSIFLTRTVSVAICFDRYPFGLMSCFSIMGFLRDVAVSFVTGVSLRELTFDT